MFKCACWPCNSYFIESRFSPIYCEYQIRKVFHGSRSTQIYLGNYLYEIMDLFPGNSNQALNIFNEHHAHTYFIRLGYLLWLVLQCGTSQLGSLHAYSKLSGNKWDTIYSGAAREHVCDRLNPGCSYRLRVYCTGEGGQSTVIQAHIV